MKEKIYIKDFLSLLNFYKKQLLIIIGVSTLCMVQLSFILPKTYKAEFELNIYTKYFKNALINDVIPAMNSIAEMTQTTDSMVKETLNDKFIDELGVKFNIYPKNISDTELARAREQLRGRFELYGTGGQSYKVVFNYKDPAVTFEISKLVLEAVRTNFINSRLETIELAKKTIMQKLESANVNKQISDESISANALASKNPVVLKSEILKINADLSALKMQFNIQHPRIVKLQQRKATIENWLKEVSPNANTKESESDNLSEPDVSNDTKVKEYSDTPLIMSADHETSQNIMAKLYSKFNDITIALDIERKSLPSYIGVIVAPQIPTAPVFPKKKLFASLGFLVGLVFCFIYVFYFEVMQMSTTDRAKLLAQNLHGEYFGTMPHIDEIELMTNKEISFEESKLLRSNSESSRLS